MKNYLLLFAALFIATAAKAQYNYYEFGAGGELSYERGYTNITKQYSHLGIDFSVFYNFNPYIPIALELQHGQLSGGGTTVNLDPYGRKYVNNYTALLLHMDIHLGAFIDYEDSWFLTAVKNFYGGSGVALVFNNNTVQRTNAIAANGATSGPDVYVFAGSDGGVNLGLPLRVGYEFKIFDDYGQPAYAIDLGYVHSFVFGEGLDGYDADPKVFKNQAIDQYRQITLGFKYFFGNTVSYNKLIRGSGY